MIDPVDKSNENGADFDLGHIDSEVPEPVRETSDDISEIALDALNEDCDGDPSLVEHVVTAGTHWGESSTKQALPQNLFHFHSEDHN